MLGLAFLFPLIPNRQEESVCEMSAQIPVGQTAQKPATPGQGGTGLLGQTCCSGSVPERHSLLLRIQKRSHSRHVVWRRSGTEKHSGCAKPYAGPANHGQAATAGLSHLFTGCSNQTPGVSDYRLGGALFRSGMCIRGRVRHNRLRICVYPPKHPPEACPSELSL